MMTPVASLSPVPRSRATYAAAVWAAACMLSTMVWAQERNLISNGGFEEGSAGWTLGDGHAIVTETGAARSGRACLSGDVTEPNKHYELSRDVPVSAGNLYRFELWARATNRTKLVLWVVPPGASKRTMVASWENLPTGWKRCETPISVSSDGKLVLQIIAPSSWGGSPPGRIWVDDVALYETPLPNAASVSENQGFNDDPAMVQADDGNLYVAWSSFRDTGDSLQLARYTPRDGADPAREATWEVEGGGTTYLLDPVLVRRGRAAALLYSKEESETDWDIIVRDVGAEGPGRGMTVGPGPNIDIKPAAAAHGSLLHVAWESNRTGRRGIWYAGLTGSSQTPPQAVSTEAGSNYAPAIAVLPGGTVCVAWHSFRNHNYDVYLRRRGPDGTWGPEVRLTRAPTVDRHPVLFTQGGDLWMVYENARCAQGYRIGATNRRRLYVVQITADNRLLAPKGMDTSPLAGRCEAPCPVFDHRDRLWIAHLRPRLPRAGWDAFLTAYAGDRWLPLQRVSSDKGMDRTPALVVTGSTALVCGQIDDLPKTWEHNPGPPEWHSNIYLARVDIGTAAGAAGPHLVPFAEPEDESEVAALRQARGEDMPTPAIEYRGETLHLYYGDLHEHTNVSVCNRVGDQTIDESYQHMRDIVRLDFACVTDHGYNINPYLWAFTAKLARVNSDPNRFLTFLGEEWTSSFERYSDEHPYGYHGHRNLVLADAYFPRWWNANNGQTPAEVWDELRAMDADFVHIPHQIADTGNVPCNWNFVDETAQPVAEIFQTRGSYEYHGAPRQAKRSTPPGYYIQDAWARDIVIGVIASPDHGGGLGKACVYAPELTRKAILDALRARHCFGSTGARIVLDVRVNGHLMGEKVPDAPAGPVTIQMAVRCPATIRQVEICRNNEFIYSNSPNSTTFAAAYTDRTPLPTKSYYYVRVIQEDDEIAWSSPVWLGYD